MNILMKEGRRGVKVSNPKKEIPKESNKNGRLLQGNIVVLGL